MGEGEKQRGGEGEWGRRGERVRVGEEGGREGGRGYVAPMNCV